MDNTPGRLAALLNLLGHESLAAHPQLADWARLTRSILAGDDSSTPLIDGGVRALLAGWLQVELTEALRASPDDTHVLLESRTELSPGVLRWIVSEAGPDPENTINRLALYQQTRDELLSTGDIGLLEGIYNNTWKATVALGSLRDLELDPLAQRLETIAPEMSAIAQTADPLASVEHESGPDTASSPLLNHLCRTLFRKLAGLEQGEQDRFEQGNSAGLTPRLFQEEVHRVDGLRADGVLVAVRIALMHLDFAKGGSPQQRAGWQNAGVDLSVHNRAAVRILQTRAEGPFGPAPSATRPLASLALALIESHGLAGQSVRGETPLALFAPFARWLRVDALELARALSLPLGPTIDIACDALHIVNVCDTAGVREDLLTDALLLNLRSRIENVRRIALSAFDERDLESDPHTLRPVKVPLSVLERELQRFERQRWNDQLPGLAAVDRARVRLTDRISRLRKGQLDAGEPLEVTRQLLDGLSDRTVARLDNLMTNAQFWYCESATGRLSPGAQLRVLALALSRAEQHPETDTAHPFHVSFQPLLSALHPDAQDEPSAHYRMRLVEALVADASIDRLLEEGPDALDGDDTPLGTFTSHIGTEAAVDVGFEESPEASALLTLLPIYERKSSAAFHSTLKSLCDLYGLRKDEFDRLSNESSYLVTMNAARSDKARMLDYARPGTIVEVGPGGGVVLGLLEKRFPDSRIVGLDISHMVVRALREKKEQEGHNWEIVEGDAYEMPRLMGESSVDTVIFCSVLHEIFSFVEEETPEGTRQPYQLTSVKRLLQSSWQCLVPGGRLVIRDGVMPPREPRILELQADDARESLELFARQFEGRPIEYEDIDVRHVKIDAADAMEFLYCYTWGAESFPYEVREQYGILPYAEYQETVLRWLADVEKDHPPVLVDLPAELQSYLQPGYREGLEGKARLFHLDGTPAELPDSNCLLVFEKRE